MTEWRRHPRVKEEIPVRWAMPKEGIWGSGVVRNVSISGLLLEVDDYFKPVENAQFTVDLVDANSVGIIPRDAKMVWCSHIITDKKRKFCGLKFVDPTGPSFSRLKDHVDSRLEGLLAATDLNIINHYLHQSN